MKNKKNLTLFICFGVIYVFVEMLLRAAQNQVITLADIVSMFFIGGFAMLLVEGINNVNWIRKNLNVSIQSLLGSLAITSVEFVGGLIVNVWPFQFKVWSYINLPFNLMGQVCLYYSVLWFFLSPLGFWFGDYIRYQLYGEGNIYSLSAVYKNLFKFRAKPQFQVGLEKE